MPETEQAAANARNNSRSTEALDRAASLAAALGTVDALPLRPQDAELLDGMETFRFGPDGSRKAWSVGRGPLVILVHGYSGLGVQMASLAIRLANSGFRSVFFDAGGHGASEPEKIGFSTFIRDTGDIVAHLDAEVHALVGHSAGALAMMRARAMYGVKARRYGVINAPLFPYVPLDIMRAVGAPEDAIDHIKAILSDQFAMSWSELVSGAAYASEDGAGLLAIYDEDDPKVRHSDGDALAEVWPGTRLIKTKGHGHNRTLRAEEVGEAISDFLAA